MIKHNSGKLKELIESHLKNQSKLTKYQIGGKVTTKQDNTKVDYPKLSKKANQK